MILRPSPSPTGRTTAAVAPSSRRRRRGRGAGRTVVRSHDTAVLVFALLALTRSATPSSVSVSDGPSPTATEGLRFWDGILLRGGDDDDVVSAVTTRPGSSVVEVMLRSNSRMDEGDASYRLCRLTTMLPISSSIDGVTPVGDYALNIEGAALLAVHHFNSKQNSIIPDLGERIGGCNVRLTLDHRDTRRSPMEASRVLLDDVLLPSSTQSGGRPRHAGPIAILGASLSPVSAALSILSSSHSPRTPVISSLSQSSALDNTGVYGLFGRTNPSGSGDAVAAAGFLREMWNVTHCGVLFVKDEYGSAFASDFAASAAASSSSSSSSSGQQPPPLGGGQKPMVVKTVAFDRDGNAESIRSAISRLKSTGYNYIFCVCHFHHVDTILTEALNLGGIIGPTSGRVWTFPYGISSSDERLASAVNGLTYLSYGFEPDEKFRKEWKVLEEDEELKGYFVENQPGHLDMTHFTFPPNPSLWEALAYDAVMAVGIAACESSEYFFDGADLHRAFTETSFVGASGKVDFLPSGSRDPSRIPYGVSNIVADGPRDPGGGGGPTTFTVREVARQMWEDGDDDGSVLRWRATHPITFADGGTVAPPSLPLIVEDKHTVSAWAIGVGLTLAVMAAASSIGWGVWTVWHRGARVVQISQRGFLIMLCCGTFVMASTIIPMSVQEPSSQRGGDVACMSVPWLYSLGFTLTFSALFSKTAKLNKMFSARRRRFSKRIKIHAKEFMVPFLLLLSSTVSILIAWTVVAPLRWERVYVANSVDQYGRDVESFATCRPEEHGNGKSTHLVFLMLLIVLDFCSVAFAVYQNYRARKIVTDYDESRYVSVSMLCLLQTIVIGVPAIVSVHPSPTPVFLLGSIFVSVTCGVVLFPLFLPKELARRRDAAEKIEREQSKSNQSKFAKEWCMWHELTTKNESLKKQLDELKTSRGCTSGKHSAESLIYYSPHSSVWQEDTTLRPVASSNDEGSVEDTSSRDQESDEASQTQQQSWNAGLDQLFLSSSPPQTKSSAVASSQDGDSDEAASSHGADSDQASQTQQQPWNAGLDQFFLSTSPPQTKSSPVASSQDGEISEAASSHGGDSDEASQTQQQPWNVGLDQLFL